MTKLGVTKLIATVIILFSKQSGVHAQNDTDCGSSDVLLAPITITSPDYPLLDYPDESYCTWNVIGIPGTRLRITFDSFQTERQFDTLTIYDGPLWTDTLAHLTGELVLPAFVSTTHQVSILFSSDSSVTDIGFSLHVTPYSDYNGITGSACEADCSSVQDGDYQSCDSCTEYITCSGGQQVISDCEYQKTWDNSLQECQDDDSTTCVQPAVQDERACFGGVNVTAPLTVMSPNFPNGDYDNYTKCTWNISGHTGNIFKMTVTDNNIEYCNNLCGCDQVRISDVFDDGTSQLITRVCGSTIPDVIWTTSDKAQVTFMSDLLYSDRGFSMNIEEAFPGDVTGADCIHSCEELSNGKYQSCESCDVFIKCKKGVSIPKECPDGETWDDTDKLCAATASKTCFVRGPPFPVTDAPATTTSPPEIDDDPCAGGIEVNVPFNITSPNYPRYYSPNVNCMWTVNSDPGTLVRVDFEMLDIEGCIEGAACPSDYIRVHDGEDETSPILLTQYGQDKITLHSTSNQAHLLFNSDLAVQYVGFKAQLTEANIGSISDLSCVYGCEGRQDGDYYRCDSCRKYVTCSSGEATINKCKKGKQWNGNKCTKKSTCEISKS